VGLKLNGTHQLLAYADGVSLLGDNKHKKSTETLIDASMEVGIEINAEKTNYMFENALQFKYLGMTVTNQN
jgi:hypothetical protein